MFRGASLAFLLVGAGIGFAGIYLSMHKRAADLVKPLPMLKPRSAQAEAPELPPPPPLDTARLTELQAAVTANPRNLEAMVELGTMQADQKNYEGAAKWY